ncbi:MAG: tetratricopeptide repeat protein [Candidatus Omnitrophica bacterium]|nr:tetratricopeptide repeat protein [Candidatus Omnitrophota bacterium]
MKSKMRKILLGIGIFLAVGIISVFLLVHEKTYQSKHFIVYSDMPPIFRNLILEECEAYYQGVYPKYFSKGFDKRLKIYYKRTASKSEKVFGFYQGAIPAVFMSRDRPNGVVSGWGTLFHEIGHHFAQINYGNTPMWFNEGVAAFLGETSRIVNGKLVIGSPNPMRELDIRNAMEAGNIISISKLIAMSDSEFSTNIGYNESVTRAFFYWLYSRGKLIDFLAKVKDQWHGIETIENIFVEKIGVLNEQFIAFIKTECYAGAYLKDGQDVDDVATKKEAYTKALSLKPNYDLAKYLLAEEVYEETDAQKATNIYINILRSEDSSRYADAAFNLGRIFFKESNFVKARAYYQLSWDASDYDEEKYKAALKLAWCNIYLGDKTNAKKWFRVFVKYDYEPNTHSKDSEFANGFLNNNFTCLNEDKIRYNQGCKYAEEGKLDEAIYQYQASVTINPSFSDGYYNLACAYARKCKSAEAIQNLKRAIKLNKQQREYAKKDEDFNGIRNEKDFQDLVAEK